MLEIIMFLLIGSIGGFFSGMFGIGGGVILIPLLIYLANIPIQSAIFISLIFIVVAPLSGMLAHWRLGNIDFNAGMWLGISSVLGAIFGATLSTWSSDIILKFIYLGVVLVATLMLLIPSPEGCNENNCKSPKQKMIAVFIGLGKGILTGMLGVGGGFIVLPLMLCFMRMNVLTAIGTSTLITLISGIAGLFSKLTIIEPLTISSWVIIASAIPTAHFGSRVASQTRPKFLRIFLFIILVVAFLTTLQDVLRTQLYLALLY